MQEEKFLRLKRSCDVDLPLFFLFCFLCRVASPLSRRAPLSLFFSTQGTLFLHTITQAPFLFPTLSSRNAVFVPVCGPRPQNTRRGSLLSFSPRIMSGGAFSSLFLSFVVFSLSFSHTQVFFRMFALWKKPVPWRCQTGFLRKQALRLIR